jgi:hypothetical protein
LNERGPHARASLLFMHSRSRFTRGGLIAAALVAALTFSSSSASAQPVVVASGLDSPRHLSFAGDGELYRAEAGRGGTAPVPRIPRWVCSASVSAAPTASSGLLNGPIGALKKINPGSSQHETVIGGLFAPYGVAFGGGHAYLSTCAVCMGGGEVIKIPLG